MAHKNNQDYDFEQLRHSDTFKGGVLISAGLVLLLQTLGLLSRTFNTFLFIFSASLILYGLAKGRFIPKIHSLFTKYTNNTRNKHNEQEPVKHTTKHD